MSTWTNLFEGANIYTDVFYAYPTLYLQSVAEGSALNLYNQLLLSVPGDISMTIGIFYNSLLPITLLLAVAHSLVMPIIRRPQRF